MDIIIFVPALCFKKKRIPKIKVLLIPEHAGGVSAEHNLRRERRFRPPERRRKKEKERECECECARARERKERERKKERKKERKSKA